MLCTAYNETVELIILEDRNIPLKNLNIPWKATPSRLRTIDAGKRVRIKRKILRASLNPDFLHTVLFGK
jgi:hypothetical protein